MIKTVAVFNSFSVNNLNKAKSFYKTVLGLRVEETGMGLRLHLPKAGMVFLYEKQDHKPATFTVLNFVVENIDAAVDTLKSQGIEFLRYEGFYQDEKGIARGIAAKKGPDIAWFTDPSENILSVLQDK